MIDWRPAALTYPPCTLPNTQAPPPSSSLLGRAAQQAAHFIRCWWRAPSFVGYAHATHTHTRNQAKMLRRLLQQPSARGAAAAVARATNPAASLSTAPPAAVEGTRTGLRQAAFDVIRRAAPKPLHNREVFERLEAGLPKDVSPPSLSLSLSLVGAVSSACDHRPGLRLLD